MNSASGSLSKIRFWHIWILLALISALLKFNPIVYFLGFIFLSFYFWLLLPPIANSACRFFFKENIIDTREHLTQKRLEIYNYTGLLRDYLKLELPPRSDLRSSINLERHDDAVTTLTISSDGRWLISGSKDNTLRMWDLEEMQAPFIMTGHQGQINNMRALFILTDQDPINSVAMTPDSRLLISSSSDRTIKVWDIGSLTRGWSIGSLTRKFQLKSESRIAHDNAHLCLGLIIIFLKILVFISMFELYRSGFIQADGIVHRYDGEPYTITQTEIAEASFLLFAGLLFVLGIITHVLYYRVAFSINKYLENRYNPDDVGQIVVTPDNETVIFGASDKTLKVWDLTNRTQPVPLGEHGDRITSVAVIDNNRVISGSYDRKLKGWNLGEHREIFTLDHSSPVTAVTVIPNRDRAISGLSNGDLKVWNLATRQTERTFEDHDDAVKAIAVTPDGKYFVSVSSDCSVKIWHVSTDEEVTSTPITSFTAEHPLTCCAVASTVASNGALIVIVGDESGQIRFLRWEGSELLP